jgi:hypothetical protein
MQTAATPNAQPGPAGANAAQHVDTPAGLALVEEALERLRYGAIQLTVHDGRLVQIDVTERTRFSAKG